MLAILGDFVNSVPCFLWKKPVDQSCLAKDGPALEEVVALSACGRGFAAQLRNGVVCWGDPQQGGDNSQARQDMNLGFGML